MHITTMNIRLVLAAALASLITAPAAYAANNFWYLKNGPLSKFSETDFKLLRGAMDTALAGAPDGPAQNWRNDHGQASGTVTPDGTDPAAGADCRRLRIASSHDQLKSEGVYTFCRDKTGRWKFK